MTIEEWCENIVRHLVWRYLLYYDSQETILSRFRDIATETEDVEFFCELIELEGSAWTVFVISVVSRCFSFTKFYITSEMDKKVWNELVIIK